MDDNKQPVAAGLEFNRAPKQKNNFAKIFWDDQGEQYLLRHYFDADNDSYVLCVEYIAHEMGARFEQRFEYTNQSSALKNFKNIIFFEHLVEFANLKINKKVD